MVISALQPPVGFDRVLYFASDALLAHQTPVAATLVVLESTGFVELIIMQRPTESSTSCRSCSRYYHQITPWIQVHIKACGTMNNDFKLLEFGMYKSMSCCM